MGVSLARPVVLRNKKSQTWTHSFPRMSSKRTPQQEQQKEQEQQQRRQQQEHQKQQKQLQKQQKQYQKQQQQQLKQQQQKQKQKQQQQQQQQQEQQQQQQWTSTTSRSGVTSRSAITSRSGMTTRSGTTSGSSAERTNFSNPECISSDGVVLMEGGFAYEQVVILGETFDELGVCVAPYPSGDADVDRSTVFQYANRMLFHSMFSSPVDYALQMGAKVLDVGSGASQWLIQMAHEYPQARFVGVDLQPQALVNHVPPNITLVRANILQGMPFPDGEFDFVHVRGMHLSFRTTDWLENVVPEVIRVAKPGGWIEFSEYDNRFRNAGPHVVAVNETYHLELLSRDIDGSVIVQMPTMLQDMRGIMNVNQVSVPVPFAPMHGRLGLVCTECMRTEFWFVEPIFCVRMGLDHDAYVGAVDQFVRETHEYDTHTGYARVFAQKAYPERRGRDRARTE